MEYKDVEYRLNVSADTHRDIDEITRYIANDLNSPQAAASFLDDVEESYRRVIKNPFMYALCSDAYLRKKGYRKVVIKNYLIFYRVTKTPKTVHVIRILYGARDYTKLL